jgi:hypothetical protein
LSVADKQNQVGLEIDFRASFAQLEGFPDACKGFGVVDKTDCLFALFLRKQLELIHRIVTRPGLQDFGFAIEGLQMVGSCVGRLALPFEAGTTCGNGNAHQNQMVRQGY